MCCLPFLFTYLFINLGDLLKPILCRQWLFLSPHTPGSLFDLMLSTGATPGSTKNVSRDWPNFGNSLATSATGKMLLSRDKKMTGSIRLHAFRFLLNRKCSEYDRHLSWLRCTVFAWLPKEKNIYVNYLAPDVLFVFGRRWPRNDWHLSRHWCTIFPWLPDA